MPNVSGRTKPAHPVPITKSQAPQLAPLVEFIRDPPWSDDHFLADMPRKWELSFAWQVDEKLVGFCIMSEPIPGLARIHLFGVGETHRSHGIGSAMLEEAIRRAQAIGARELALKAASARAHAFYLRRGFRDTGGDGFRMRMSYSLAPQDH